MNKISKKITIRLETSKKELEDEQTASTTEEFSIDKIEPIAAPSGSPIEKAHFVDLVAATVVTTGGWIAKRMFDKWMKDKQQGVQIDLRKTPAAISRIAGTPRGFLVIIDKEGKVKTQQLQYSDRNALAESLSTILGE